MRLKSIEMQGFKSFADKIYLDFNSGVTAIVGPNGSGKSNISDAIRWVMGEQSIKSLRGSRMEDVIFSGTETRKPLGFAEVTLTLDNTDEYFELDFPEVSVTRRVYRSGEGEYYINKTACRLKDVHELFMDTGLGRDGYSIIGQGKIDSILSTKSEDRRQIFEEAAGISKYKYRKVEAERKLDQTVDNLTRVRDILSELEGQLEPLFRQSEKAKKYLVLRDELRGLDINASIVNIDKIKSELKKLNSDLEILNSQINDINAELSEFDEKISAMYGSMRGYDGELAKLSDEEREIALKTGEAEKTIGILKNDIEHNSGNIERLDVEIEHVMESIKLADKELDAHKKRLAELNEESLQNLSEIEELSEKAERAGANIGERSGALDDLKTGIIDITAELNSLRGAIDNMKILGASFENRKRDIEKELEARGKDKLAVEKQLSLAKEAEAAVKEEISDAEVARHTLEIKLKDKKEENETLAESHAAHMLELAQKKSRSNMLKDMERELEGYAKGVKGVMRAYTEGRFGKAEIYGPLAQLIRTDKKYITAVETALGAAGQNIVTATEEEAKAAIAYLKTNNLGRATFLPVSAIRAKRFDKSAAERNVGYIAVAAELIECEERYREIVLSFLGTTVVCDNIDNAVSMAKNTAHKFRIVTLGGDVIQAGGAMTGGSAVKTVGSISRAGEIEMLLKETEKLEKINLSEEKKLKELKEQALRYEKELAELDADILGKRGRLAIYAADRQRFETLAENMKSSGDQLEKELKDIRERLLGIIADENDKLRKIEEKTKRRENLERSAARAQEEFGRLSGENEKLTARLTELNIKRSTILKDIELENERISAITNLKGDQLESVTVKRGGIETLKNRNASIEEEIADLAQTCSRLKDRAQECLMGAEKLNEARLATENKIRERQNEVKDTQEKRFALLSQASKLELRIEKLNADREGIINRMWDDYELTYSDALELKTEGEFDYKTASVRICELKDSIKKLGNINIDAIEEYKAVKERFDFLTVQTEDLEKAKSELDSVIEEMMDIMKSRFADQFKIININFNRVFGELFGGGRAELSLTEPENVLESGIEIEAQPPGKKLQSLTLLSGGERAFTAIALLFAILDVRPTPFCILDEIEAALDDVNVYRFADYLKQYSKKTQFIVVTHRRGTMESANILYGVTMQERGISKLLSLNIDEAKG